MVGNIEATLERMTQEDFGRSLFDEYIDIEFEGYNFMMVKDADTLLTIEYGDYMKMPPESERISLHFVDELVFNDYVIDSD